MFYWTFGLVLEIILLFNNFVLIKYVLSFNDRKKFPGFNRRKLSAAAELNQLKPSEQGSTSPNVLDISVKMKSVVLSNKNFSLKKFKNFKEVKVILSLHPDNKRQSSNYLAVHDLTCMLVCYVIVYRNKQFWWK